MDVYKVYNPQTPFRALERVFNCFPLHDDKLCIPKDVAKKGLLKRAYEAELEYTYQTSDGNEELKSVEFLFGYDVYHGYACASKQTAYLCPAKVKDIKGNDTNWILKRIWRTRCNLEKLWFVMYNTEFKTIQLFKENISTYMDKQRWWPDPSEPIAPIDRMAMSR